MDDFDELTGAALVTGGSGGIGRAVVRLLARRGATSPSPGARTRPPRGPSPTSSPRTAGASARTSWTPATRSPASRWSPRCWSTTACCTRWSTPSGPHVPMVHLSNVRAAGELAAQLVGRRGGLLQRRPTGAGAAALRAEGSIVAVTTAATSTLPGARRTVLGPEGGRRGDRAGPGGRGGPLRRPGELRRARAC